MECSVDVTLKRTTFRPVCATDVGPIQSPHSFHLQVPYRTHIAPTYGQPIWVNPEPVAKIIWGLYGLPRWGPDDLFVQLMWGPYRAHIVLINRSHIGPTQPPHMGSPYGAHPEPVAKIIWGPYGLPIWAPRTSPHGAHVGHVWACWLELCCYTALRNLKIQYIRVFKTIPSCSHILFSNGNRLQ